MNNTFSELTGRKQQLSGTEIVLVILFALLIGVALTATMAWVLMLVIGVLAEFLGFTAPGFWVVFAGVIVFNFVVGSLRNRR